MPRLHDPHAFLALDEYQSWIFYMEDVLDDFFDWLPENVSEKLDFSVSSLDVIEAWLLDRYPSVDAMLEFGQAEIVDAVVRYVGKTYKKAINGRWDAILDEPDNAYYRYPVLRDKEKNHVQCCPFTLTTASADRRTGHYLRTVLENAIEDLSVQKTQVA